VLKKGRKGRISNELVAASCTAILTVYASGYWRTREEDGRYTSDAQTRRPARPVPVPASSAPVSVPVVLATVASAPVVPPQAIEPKPTAKTPLKDAAAPSPAAAAPGKPEVSVPAPVAVVQESTPQPEAAVVAEEAEPAPPSHKPWLDGYYTGWGQSRHGDIQAFVTIENGRITNAGIANCETRYPCSVISHILLQPIDLQGPDVDAVSRATESADAYYTGLVSALANAEAGIFRSTRP
jgi:uncharacterized protein with FMN-binding domain